MATLLGADGAGADLLIIPAGGSAMPASQETVEARQHYLQMNGREVFRFAIRVAPRAVEQPFVNASGPLRVAPDPAGTAVAIGVRERLEIWPEGEPAGTPTHFENSLSFVEWCEFGILAAEAHRLHVVNPEDGAILQTAAF